MKITVVTPVYNERATLETLIRRVLDQDCVLEHIVVDDGSTDGSWEVAEALAREEPRLRIYRQTCNQGKGAALRQGFAMARGEVVLVQDADLEYDPQDFPKLLAPLQEGHADVVYGSRFLSGTERRVLYFWHSVGNRALTLLSNALTNLNLSDMETGYKVFRREVLESFELEEARFGIEPELTAKVARGRWRIYEVGITYHGRTYEEGKKIGWRDGVHALVCILKYNTRR